MVAKYTDMEMAGQMVKVTSGQRKDLEKIAEELKKQHTLEAASLVIKKQMYDILKKEVDSGKAHTKSGEARLKTLEKVRDLLLETQKIQDDMRKREAQASADGLSKKGDPKFKNDRWATFDPEAVEWDKMVKDQIPKQASVWDQLKRKVGWMLPFWGTISSAFGLMVNNSKIVAHFFDFIGGALGFILDMLLIGILPQITRLGELLFNIGMWIADLPDWVKQLTVLVGLLVSAWVGWKIYEAYQGLKDIWDILKKIGGFKPPTTTVPGGGTGGTPTPVPVPGGGLPVLAPLGWGDKALIRLSSIAGIGENLSTIFGSYAPALAAMFATPASFKDTGIYTQDIERDSPFGKYTGREGYNPKTGMYYEDPTLGASMWGGRQATPEEAKRFEVTIKVVDSEFSKVINASARQQGASYGLPASGGT